MASLFLRARCRLFLLKEVTEGALWILRKRLGLGPKRHTVEAVAAALARKDPEGARRLRDTVGEVEKVLEKKEKLGEHELLQLAREVEKCL
jgi:hypothetical protein